MNINYCKPDVDGLRTIANFIRWAQQHREITFVLWRARLRCACLPDIPKIRRHSTKIAKIVMLDLVTIRLRTFNHAPASKMLEKGALMAVAIEVLYVLI